MKPLVAIRDLRVEYRTGQFGSRESVCIIDGFNLDVYQGETVGVVGESGSGKSTLAFALVRLVDPVGGTVMFDDAELVGLPKRKLGGIRQQIQLVLQNPIRSLSPRRRIGQQLHEPLTVHTDLSSNARQDRIDKLIHDLDLGPAVMDRFPHELSGGQAQRVVLARALTLQPKLIVFDEPTSALDVSVQAGVLNLLHRLKDAYGLTYLFITHDLGVARHIADRIAVMRAGEIVELRATEDLFRHPEHEYTKRLLESSPTV